MNNSDISYNPAETLSTLYNPDTLEEAIQNYLELRENRDGWKKMYDASEKLLNEVCSELEDLKILYKQLKINYDLLNTNV